jgi:tRNA-2-methylthio-N6-dimethylallyladenosine synthase
LKKKFFIKTFGCQMNKNDSSVICKILTDQGFESVDDPVFADIFIVNTCTVRAHAANRALAYISGLKSWRKEGERVLAVVGCLAKSNPDDITRRLSHVDLVLGPDSYREIANHISKIVETEVRIIDTKISTETYCGIYHSPTAVTDFVSIMRGCNNYCSYCIVPYVRGQARSRAFADICSEITHLVKHGVKEITLLGQNVNEYHYEDMNFAGLLEHTARIRGAFRIRFLTSHPKDFSKETVQVIKNHHNICEWFHLPLQSGSDRILQLMNRKYTKGHYLDLVDYIRHEIPNSTITTDLIVGFPSETEAEFLETISMLRQIEFDNAYMYRYSERPGTKASSMPSLDEDTIKRRLNDLIKVQNEIFGEKSRTMVGNVYEVLFEGTARGNGSRGKTRGNKDVVVHTRITPGEVRDVLIKEVRGHTPIGELVDE